MTQDGPWSVPYRDFIMGIKRTLVNVFERLSVSYLENKYNRANTARIYGEHDTYPGSFNVLFIEYAKCFPTEVNRSGR